MFGMIVGLITGKKYQVRILMIDIGYVLFT